MSLRALSHPFYRLNCELSEKENCLLRTLMRAKLKSGRLILPNLTLEDVAKKAGVSRSTVSRVVNGYENISDDIRNRVLQVIEETGYHPNAAARALASQRSQIIGLILPHSVSMLFTDPYYPHLLKGICQACNYHHYTLAFFLFSSEEDEQVNFNSIPSNGLLDGVIVQSDHHGKQKLINHLLERKMPHVVIGRPKQPEKVSFVDVDNIYGAKVAVTHLINLGYQRISTITGPLQSTVGIDRRKGYVDALAKQSIRVNPELIEEGDFTEQGGYNAMQQLLSRKPDAVFAASDMMAFGAIRAIKEHNLNIPEDIAIIGFDDIPITMLTNVNLTTVYQPVNELGERAVGLLLDNIENGSGPPQNVILKSKLVIRSTCGGERLRTTGEEL